MESIKRKIAVVRCGAAFTTTAICLFSANLSLQGQSYLGTDGGFEGTVYIETSTAYTSAQSGKWTHYGTAVFLSDEQIHVRSGSHALLINNTSSTGRRVWSPLISVASTTANVTVQFYRLVTDITNAQLTQPGIGNGTTANDTNGSYGIPSSASSWEKVTYTKNSWTFTDIAAVIWSKATGSGGNVYIDDVVVYAGAVDNTVPDAPSSITIDNTTDTSLSFSWQAPSSGTDNGGYLLVRGESDPSVVPNVNGIYVAGNTIGVAKVVYQGSETQFTDTGLSSDTHYYYRLYSYDKAYNYSGSVAADAITSTATGINEIPANAQLVVIRYFMVTGTEIRNPVKGICIEKSYYDNGTVVTKKIFK
jgi:hypothetical protein